MDISGGLGARTVDDSLLVALILRMLCNLIWLSVEPLSYRLEHGCRKLVFAVLFMMSFCLKCRSALRNHVSG